MASPEEQRPYGIPQRSSVWLRAALVVIGGVVVLTLLWLVMPHSALGVAIEAVLTLVLVFAAVFWVITGRDTDTSEPGPADAGGGSDRDPDHWMQPPSTQSH